MGNTDVLIAETALVDRILAASAKKTSLQALCSEASIPFLATDGAPVLTQKLFERHHLYPQDDTAVPGVNQQMLSDTSAPLFKQFEILDNKINVGLAQDLKTLNDSVSELKAQNSS